MLITGAASGLGQALTRQLVTRGDQVLATDLATDRPLSLPTGVDYLPLDVRSDDAWANALGQVTETWGGLDLLINNAGVGSAGRIETTTMKEWERVLDIDLLGVVRGARTFVPLLKAQGSGHVVNVASLAGLTPAEGMVAYATAKAGVVALSEVLEQELGEFGVNVSVVCPYYFQSNIGDSLAGEDDKSEAAIRTAATYSKLTSDDVAAIVIKGIDARKDVILTEPEGHILWRAKRFARPAYKWLLAKANSRGVSSPDSLPGKG